jgi:phosphoserine phosphatase RsbX
VTAVTQQRDAIEWSVASRARPGEAVSGDLHVIVPTRDGALLGVIDGLGHGEEATAAARMAAAVLEQHAQEPVVTIVQRCHRVLQRTRGVVLTLISVNAADNTLSAVGIGNVEAVIVRARANGRLRAESILLRCGVVGYQLPELQASVFPLEAGDVIVLATDGMREDFVDLVRPADSPAKLVDTIVSQKYRGTDDGLVLACKYLGRS